MFLYVKISIFKILFFFLAEKVAFLLKKYPTIYACYSLFLFHLVVPLITQSVYLELSCSFVQLHSIPLTVYTIVYSTNVNAGTFREFSIISFPSINNFLHIYLYVIGEVSLR